MQTWLTRIRLTLSGILVAKAAGGTILWAMSAFQ